MPLSSSNSSQATRTNLPRSLRLIRSIFIFSAILGTGIFAIVHFTPSHNSALVATTTTTTIPPPPTTTIPPPPWSPISKGLYSFTSYQTTLSEPGTKLCVEVDGSQSCGPRQLQLGIYYPVLAKNPNVVPYRGINPLPLVLFAPGYLQYYSDYSVLLDSLVNAGYVVIGMNFPLNDPSSVGGPDENDILNNPKDMSSVISWALDENQSPASPLYKLINPNEIVATGQSDGGETALALSYNSCCISDHLAATVIFSSAELSTFPGTYFPAGQDLPLLVIQGTSDPINPQSLSQQIYTSAPPPKYYLSLIGADHLVAYQTSSDYERVVASVTSGFIHAYVLKQSSYLALMTTSGNVAGVSQLTGDP